MNETIDISRVYPEWQTVRRLGRGAFGSVYEIERHYLGKTEKAALKIMDIPSDDGYIENLRASGYSDNDIRVRIRSDFDHLTAEYDRMRQLVHTNIVNCDDLAYEASADGMHYRIYIKMELLTPLLSYSSPDTPEQMARRIGIDICNALELCERRQIVHRDIKPQNLFINQFGEYKLGDFGISRIMDHSTHASKSGTLIYMAPEVYLGNVYHHEVDTYSLGLVLYWLLNERRLPFLPLPPALFTFEQENDAMNRRLNGEPLPPPKNGSNALKRIVLKACAYQPKDRYPSAAAMRADLERLSERAQVNAYQPPSVLPVNGSYSFTKEQLTNHTGVAQDVAPSYVRQKPQPQPKPEPQPQPQPQPQPKPEPKPQPQPKPEPKPQPKPQPTPKPQNAHHSGSDYVYNLDKLSYVPPAGGSRVGRIGLLIAASVLFAGVGAIMLSGAIETGNPAGYVVIAIAFGFAIVPLVFVFRYKKYLFENKLNKTVRVRVPNDGGHYALAVNNKWIDADVKDKDTYQLNKLPSNVVLCRLKRKNGDTTAQFMDSVKMAGDHPFWGITAFDKFYTGLLLGWMGILGFFAAYFMFTTIRFHFGVPSAFGAGGWMICVSIGILFLLVFWAFKRRHTAGNVPRIIIAALCVIALVYAIIGTISDATKSGKQSAVKSAFHVTTLDGSAEWEQVREKFFP